MRTYPVYRNGRPTALTVLPAATPVWPGKPLLPAEMESRMEFLGPGTVLHLGPNGPAARRADDGS